MSSRTTVMFRFRVHEYEAWKAVVDGHEDGAPSHGGVGHHVPARRGGSPWRSRCWSVRVTGRRDWLVEDDLAGRSRPRGQRCRCARTWPDHSSTWRSRTPSWCTRNRRSPRQHPAPPLESRRRPAPSRSDRRYRSSAIERVEKRSFEITFQNTGEGVPVAPSASEREACAPSSPAVSAAAATTAERPGAAGPVRDE